MRAGGERKGEGRTSHKDKYGQEYQMLIGGNGKSRANAEDLRGSVKAKKELNVPIIAPMQKS